MAMFVRVLALFLSLTTSLPGVPGARETAIAAIDKFSPVFMVTELSDETFSRMNGISWKADCPVARSDLRLVTVTHIDFGRNIHRGEIVCHRLVADELSEIFRELYEYGIPIERVELIDDYGADDRISMEANNTSSFNYRTVSGTENLSKHSYGLAIDINPIQNPYTEKLNDYVSPAAGRAYTDREDVRPGMIVPGDAVHRAFVSRGWKWGGDWIYQTDYQHFQKDISI